MNRQQEIVLKRRFPYEMLSTKRARLGRVVDDKPRVHGMMGMKVADLVENYAMDHVPYTELQEFCIPREPFVSRCTECKGDCIGKCVTFPLEYTAMVTDTYDAEDPNVCVIKRRYWRAMGKAAESKGRYVRKVGGLSYGATMIDSVSAKPLCEVCSWPVGMHGYTFDSSHGGKYVRGCFIKRWGKGRMGCGEKGCENKYECALRGTVDKWICGNCFRQHWMRSAITAEPNQPVKVYTKFLLELSYYMRYRKWWVRRCLLRSPIGFVLDLVNLVIAAMDWAEYEHSLRSDRIISII